jgi:uncharacterized membrane protein HdeD (DUF308 family)
MSGLKKAGLFVGTLALALVASWFIAKGWSPVCHEGCPVPIQAAMWIFLLAMPLAVAGVVALAAGARRLRRVGWTFAAFAVVGLALTLLAAWFQGRGHGG